MRKPVLWLALLLASPVLAQEPAPAPAPAPQVPPAQAREQNLKTLKETTVHFDFERATLEEIVIALDKATGVRVRIGKAGMRALKRRRFRMKYVADRRGDQVLTDLAKAAALDVVVTAEGVFFDVPKKIKKLRKKLGLTSKPVRLTGKDVETLLQTKTVSLAATDQPLREILSFLRKETGVRFVLLAQELKDVPISLHVTAEPLGQLLDQLVATQGLGWLRQGRVIVVDTAEKIAAQREKNEKKKQKQQEKKQD